MTLKKEIFSFSFLNKQKKRQKMRLCVFFPQKVKSLLSAAALCGLCDWGGGGGGGSQERHLSVYVQTSNSDMPLSLFNG